MTLFKSPFESAIQCLGDTTKSITAKLREKGIKGEQDSTCDCPIANYLKTFGFRNICVSHKFISFSRETIRTPLHVSQWILDFDDGDYSEFRE
jgi:hypothetical protein